MSKMKRKVAILMVLTLVVSIFGGIQWGSVTKASSEPVNVALKTNGTSISTSAPDAWCENNGYGVANMINGDTGGVYGVTAANIEYEHKETKIQLDFKQVYSVSKVQLYKTAEEAFPVDFTISVYTTDGWKTVISKVGYQSVPGCNTFEFEAVDCKSVRLISTKNGEHTGDGKYAIYLQEFEVYGVVSNTVISAEPNTVNVAASANGGTITTSHAWAHAAQYGFALENIINGLPTGNWGMTLTDAGYQNEPMNMDITFNKEYRINKVMLYAYKDAADGGFGGFPRDFELQVYSEDNWVTVAKRTDYKSVEGWNTFEFDDITCTAIRLATTENGQTDDGKYGIYLAEFEAYGYEVPKVNVALATNGTEVSTSHPDTWGEANGYGVATLNDSKTTGYWFVTENKADYQNTQMSVTTLFDKAYKINEVSLYAVEQGGFPEDFTIDVYTQNGWETVVTKTGYTATAGEQKFVFDSIDARAVRLTSTKNGAIDQGQGKDDTYGIYLYEFEVFGKASSEVIGEPSSGNEPTPPTPPAPGGEEEPPVEDTRINVALTSEIVTTHPNTWGENNGFGITNMIDGKADSGNWGITQETTDDQNTQMSITLTFDKTYKVDEACLYAVTDGGFPKDFVLEAYTKDGWKTVVTKNEYVAEAGKQSFTFEAVDCRMFRLTTTKNGLTSGGKYGVFLQEFEVYGKESDIVIVPESAGAQEQPSGETLPNVAAASNGSTISTTHPDSWGEKNGFGIANLIDGKGNTGNYGITAATAEFQNTQISISVNFKQAYKISKICLYSVADGGFPEDFTLAAYTKSGWKTVLTKRGYKAEVGCQTFEIEPVDCSAVKLISTKNGIDHQGKYGIYLQEFEVYGEVSNVSIPKAPSLGTEGAASGSASFSYNADKNIALNMPVTCNSDYAQYGFGINNVNDGNLDSPWSCNMLLVEKDKPEWVEINLLGNYKINTVALYARANGWGFPKDIKISVFYDDNWIEVVNVKNYKVSTDVKTTAEYVFKFKETIGNKIRIEGSNFNMADGEYGMQLTEIAVYGDEAIGNYILPLNNYVSSATDITTSSTLEDFGFFTLYLTDGDVKTGYSSNQHTDPNNIEWIELDLKRSLSIGSILLKPAVAGSGFPVDFEIQVMMDGKWETIHKVTDYKKPVDESWQQFVLDKQYKTDKVRIWVTKLGDDFGQYSLRLNEIEIYPSEVKDKDMEAVEVGNIEHASYNSAHTVETKTIIPTALIVSGVVVAATAFIGIVGVYILTLRKMKRKEK